MPYKSDAQRKKFHALERQGKISSSTVKEFDEASKGRNLPEKIRSISDLKKVAKRKSK